MKTPDPKKESQLGVRLTDEQCKALQALLGKGHVSAWVRNLTLTVLGAIIDDHTLSDIKVSRGALTVASTDDRMAAEDAILKWLRTKADGRDSLSFLEALQFNSLSQSGNKKQKARRQ